MSQRFSAVEENKQSRKKNSSPGKRNDREPAALHLTNVIIEAIFALAGLGIKTKGRNRRPKEKLSQSRLQEKGHCGSTERSRTLKVFFLLAWCSVKVVANGAIDEAFGHSLAC